MLAWITLCVTGASLELDLKLDFVFLDELLTVFSASSDLRFFDGVLAMFETTSSDGGGVEVFGSMTFFSGVADLAVTVFCFGASFFEEGCSCVLMSDLVTWTPFWGAFMTWLCRAGLLARVSVGL